MPTISIDPQVQAFIDRTNAHYPEDIPVNDIALHRKCYNNVCQTFATPCPANVSSNDIEIDSGGYKLKLRTYRYSVDPADHVSETAIVYYHGGGFILGNLESHHSICAEICHHTCFDVISVDYRLAPEYQYPDDVEDALCAFRYAAHRYKHVIAAGDSAGAALAVAVCIASKDNQLRPLGQLLIYAGLGGSELNLESYITHANAPLMSTEDSLFYKSIRAGSNPIPADPLFYPLLLKDYSGLPHCYAVSADIDPLRDDSREYVQNLQQAGVKATWVNEPGLVHGYLRARHCSDKAKNSFRNICQVFLDMVENVK